VAAEVVFSSGFSEIGAEGVTLERDLKAAIRESGVRVLGSNCLGLINAVSCFGAAAGVRLKELDLNPVLAGHAGATAVDWLLILNQ
jgi:acyl-CoA synthetase (NDP forming)